MAFNPPTTHIDVFSLEGFPTPVGGIITLKDNYSYIIHGLVDISPNRIVCGLRNAITGINRRNDILMSNTSGVLITANAKVALICDEVSFSCSNGAIIDSTNTTTSFLSCGLGPCLSGGTVVSTTGTGFTMRTSGFTVSGTGIAFSGISTGNVRIFDNVINSSAGIAFDLGVAVFNNVNISRNEAMLQAGSSFLSGTTGSGNVITYGRLNLNQFSGLGTPILGISNSDTKWYWLENAGIVNTLEGYQTSVVFANEGIKTVTITDPRIKATDKILSTTVIHPSTTTWFTANVTQVDNGSLQVRVVPQEVQGAFVKVANYTGTVVVGVGI